MPSNSPHKTQIVIAGAGIAGLMSAILLSRQGYPVAVRDRRPEPRGETPYSGRSVNFTLSYRGREMLRRAGVLQEVLRHAVPLRGRAIHLQHGQQLHQPYGTHADEVLHAIRRIDLHRELLLAAIREENVSVKFEHELKDVQLDNNRAFFQRNNGDLEQLEFDLFIGADGAFSRAQDLLIAQRPVTRTRELSDWRYIEFEIPSNASGKYSLDPAFLHLWPKSDSLICAIPNPDNTFVANLIMPSHLFESLKVNDADQFLRDRFADLLPLIKIDPSEITKCRVSDIVTSSVSNWQFEGKAVLLGDACHAISPFLGQGMNAALEDASILAEHLNAPSVSMAQRLKEFEQARKPDTDALGELSRSHLNQLSTHLASPWHIAGQTAEVHLAQRFPSHFKPLYSLIAHSTTRYSEALKVKTQSNHLRTRTILTGLQAYYFARNQISMAAKRS
jgi:kynurenine 3-monooxygenase